MDYLTGRWCQHQARNQPPVCVWRQVKHQCIHHLVTVWPSAIILIWRESALKECHAPAVVPGSFKQPCFPARALMVPVRRDQASVAAPQVTNTSVINAKHQVTCFECVCAHWFNLCVKWRCSSLCACVCVCRSWLGVRWLSGAMHQAHCGSGPV